MQVVFTTTELKSDSTALVWFLQEVFTTAAREALTARLQGSLSAANALAAADVDKELRLQVWAAPCKKKQKRVDIVPGQCGHWLCTRDLPPMAALSPWQFVSAAFCACHYQSPPPVLSL